MGDAGARQAGLLSFLASLLSLVTGLLFSVLVARRLALEDYGAWQFYSTVISYLMLPGVVVNFWLTRDLGHGRRVLKTGVVSCGLLGALTSFILVGSSIMSSSVAPINMDVLLALVANLIAFYLSSSLDSASIGVAPSLYGVGLIVQETVKVIAGAILVVWLRTGLLGAILSIDIALFSKVATMYLKMPPVARGELDISIGLLWLRRSWVPILSLLPGLLSSFDILILAWLVGSTRQAAYLALAKTVAAAAGYPQRLAISLESKLLGGKGDEHIEESIRLVMMFALPMTAGLVVLALPIAYVFGRNYSPAAVPLQLLSLASFLSIIYGISLTILQGAERVDTQVGVSSGDIIRSSLAMPRVIETVARALCVLASLVVLSLVRTWDPSSEASVTILALMNLLVTLALSLSMLRMSRRTHGYVVPWRDLSRYALATIVMTLALLGLYPVGAISDRIFDVLVNLLPVVVAGGIVYFTVLLAIDQRLRNELREVGNVWRARRKSQRQKDLHPAESER